MLLMDEAVSVLRRPDSGAGANDSFFQIQQHLKELWGLAINDDIPVLVVATTNSPEKIDLHDFRRRLDTIVHVGLPDYDARCQLWADGIRTVRNEITDTEIKELAAASEGHSGRDIFAMVKYSLRSLWKEVRNASSFAPVSLAPPKQYRVLMNPLQVNFMGRNLLEPAQSSSAGGSESYQQLGPADRRRTVYLPLNKSKLVALLKMSKFKTVTAAETKLHRDFQESLGTTSNE